jgi:hypothetical protein
VVDVYQLKLKLSHKFYTPPGFIIFIVGGLDFFDITELEHEFKKKPHPTEGGAELDRAKQKEAVQPAFEE